MLTEIKTSADMLKLPFYVTAALNFQISSGLRSGRAIQKASKKQMIQTAVVRAIEEKAISFDLGRELLIARDAYGPKGKKALESCK